MNQMPDILEDLFEDVLKERDAKSEAKGEAKGEARGEAREARSILLMLCAKRLGEPSQSVVANMEKIERLETLHALIRDFDKYESWDEMLN